MSVSRKENGSLVKKAGLGIIDNILNRFSNRAISNSAVTNQLSANDNLFKAAYQDGKYGFTVDGDFYEIGGGGMPILDYANPLHTFTSGNLTYTATKECYVCGYVAFGDANIAVNLAINNTIIATGTYNSNLNYVLTKYIPPLKIKAGDVVTVTSQCNMLHVFEEA